MRKHNIQKGFTLIELMTALSIFAIIMTISMGSIVGIFDANRKSRSQRTVMANLNLAVESMSKEMRYGRTYHCGTTGNEESPQNCASGNSYISFLSSEDEQVTYRLSGSALERKVDNGNFAAVTAPEIILDTFSFYVTGAGTGDGIQPKVFIVIKGHAGTGKARSDFAIQTLVSQRALDI